MTLWGGPSRAAGASAIGQAAHLTPATPLRSAWFGYSTAVFGNTVAVGAPGEGVVFVYVQSDANWTLQATLTGSDFGISELFGWAVSLSGDTLAVGAPGNRVDPDGNSAPYGGAVYVFVRAGTVWVRQAYLVGAGGEPGDQFGVAVAVFGDTLAIGADQEFAPTTDADGNPLTAGGSVYLFKRDGNPRIWRQAARLFASNADRRDRFGAAVGLSQDHLIVGAPYEASSFRGVQNTSTLTLQQGANNAPSAGAAYVFRRTESNWVQQAYLKSFNADTGDNFGTAVDISRDIAIVGAPSEDGPGGGDTAGAGNHAPNSGAAYVFQQQGSRWSQLSYIKAPNVDSGQANGDSFGDSVAVEADRLVVGASREDGSAPGVDGDLNDNRAPSAGAAYLYQRIGAGAAWTFQAYFKASNPAASAYFGWGVGLSGDLVVSGAHGVNASSEQLETGAAYVFSGISSGDREGVVLAQSPLIWPLGQPALFSGTPPTELRVDANAGLRVPESTGWENGELELEIQPFVAGEDELVVLGDGAGLSGLTVVGSAIRFDGAAIASVGAPRPGLLRVVFNQAAGHAGVLSVLRNLACRNLRYASHVTSNQIGALADRNVLIRLRDGSRDWGTVARVVRFPALIGIECLACPSHLDLQEDVIGTSDNGFMRCSGVFSQGQRRPFSSTAGVTVSSTCSSSLLSVEHLPNGVGYTAHGGAGTCGISVQLGPWQDAATITVNDPCFMNFMVAGRPAICDFGPLQLADLPSAPPGRILGDLQALQSLMNRTEEGKRLASLYRAHTRELLGVAARNPSIFTDADALLQAFQPGVGALLSGKGETLLISQSMIDGLKTLWESVSALAAPALRSAMDAERNRAGGFDGFVELTFSEWADALQLEVPQGPHLHAFNPRWHEGNFKVEANYIPGLVYSLWSNAEPAVDGWVVVSDASTELGINGVELTVPGPSARQRFFRVQGEAVAGEQ